MSCQFRLAAQIQDVNELKNYLFPVDESKFSENWLHLCEVSVSPTGDIIAVAYERKLAVLASKWDVVSQINHFQISYLGTIHEYDKVKAVICLPVVEENNSSYVVSEWTCIVIGFDSGYLRFYTENCELLFEEQYHTENITSIKCQSQHSPRPDISPDLHPEEIYVQYQSNICVISSPKLILHLRNCRSSMTAQSKSSYHSITLRKLSFHDQCVVNDVSVVGLSLGNAFDHLLTASTCGGFDSRYRATPPHNTLVLAAGSRPFLGYHYALEGGVQPALGDVVKAVGSKLKSALPGWFMGNKVQHEKQMALAAQPAEAMGCRFGLHDLRRTITRIILSPNGKVAAACDTLGRVLLIDTSRGVVLKIFKGYRDAQCSFVQVPDEKKSKYRLGDKIAHFLIIYSPKKGTLEVFSLQHGATISTFTASKHSRLFYIDYSLMGFTTTSKSRYICHFTNIFIDNDGKIKEIQIPFHFSLSEKNSRRSRDVHLFKKLKQLVKSRNYVEETLFNESYDICTELKTSEIKLQSIEMLINQKIPSCVLRHCAQHFAEVETNGLKTLCENIVSLLNLYVFVTENKLHEENGNIVQGNSTILNLDEKEMNKLQKLLDLSTMNDSHLNEVHVSFSDNSLNSSSAFLAIFDLATPEKITLKTKLDEGILFQFAEIIFKSYITGDLTNFDELQKNIVKSKIKIENVFYMLINYWVNKSLHIGLNLEKEMDRLSHVIYVLTKTIDKRYILSDYNQTSNFWSEVREVLSHSYRPFPALIAAILCKNIAQKIESEIYMDKSSSSLEEEGMELLSQENVNWSILIGKLEDISLLNIILSKKPVVKNSPLPKLQHEKVNISLKYVLEQGRGSVSELTARWFTLSGIDPQSIFTGSEDEEIFEQFNLLKEQFPYSLETNAVLANMTWEYALAWQKDIQDLGMLEASIKCLDSIQDFAIKQGLYQVLWNTHLKILNESACKLINKVGRLPKERLCRQDTGLSDYQLTVFLRMTTDFLDAFMEVARGSYDTSYQVSFENIWDNNGQSLVELAVQQKQVNYELLHLHYQLSLVLQMITALSVKHQKLVNNLFEPSVVNLLFTDFQRKIELNWNKSDIRINSSRQEFLNKVISASMESLTVNDTGKIYSTDHVFWMAKCLSLARFWNLDVDVFRRYQLVGLYTNGFDLLAEELMPAINDRNALGVDLLVVAAKRLSQFLVTSPDLSENIVALSPLVTKYIETLDQEWCAPCPLSNTTNLAVHVLRCLNETQHEHKLAELLLEAYKSLEEIQS